MNLYSIALRIAGEVVPFRKPSKKYNLVGNLTGFSGIINPRRMPPLAEWLMNNMAES